MKLARIERHHLAAAFVPIVLPAEADRVVGHGEEPSVRDGDAVGVAAETGQRLPEAAEGRLGVDHPVDPVLHRLTPSVLHRHAADLGAEMARVGRDDAQRLGGGAE